MNRNESELQVLAQLAHTASAMQTVIAVCEGWDDDGNILVLLESGSLVRCGFLERCNQPRLVLTAGDRLLVFVSLDLGTAVVAGRVGRYAVPRAPARRTVEAADSLTLKCGESSLELRADGRVLLKGDDVLIRAKGTQRIRAGNVAIN